jgi:hypothetical protein
MDIRTEISRKKRDSTRFRSKVSSSEFNHSTDMCNESTATNYLVMNDPCIVFTSQRIKIVTEDKLLEGLSRTLQNPSFLGQTRLGFSL